MIVRRFLGTLIIIVLPANALKIIYSLTVLILFDFLMKTD